MPKIPTYLASLDYKPPRGDLDTAEMPGQMLAKFGESVGEFGDNLAKQAELAERQKQAETQRARQAELAAWIQRAEAEDERAKGMSQSMTELHRTIENFKANAGSGATMESLKERIDAIGQDVAVGIRNPEARDQVASSF